ncbi:MAG: IclR family transcriptional regulator [Pseudomonadota bacterium]
MVDIKEKADRGGIQVITRAAAILRVLKDETGGASLGQIATAVGLPRSTVQRIVGALVAERLVIASANGRGLRLGPEVSALAQAVRHDVVDTCRDVLMTLARDTGETADLSVMRGAGMIFLDQVSGNNHRLRTVSSVGEVFPLTTTANGKACLARMPQDKATTLATAEWAQRGVAGDIDGFSQQLASIRDTRLAYDISEHTQGIAAIGFAFADQAGDLYAISVPVPMIRFDNARPGVEAALRRAADQVDGMLR